MKTFDMVIIGAGPAGIACAVEGKLKGKSVCLLEKGGEISQSMRQFYKAGKRVDVAYKGYNETNHSHLPFVDSNKEDTLKMLEDQLKAHDITPIFHCEVEGISPDGDGVLVKTAKENYHTKCAVIAIGRMGKPNKPSYKIPFTLNKVVNYNANSVQAGEKVLVIGGGNSAAEYAIDLCSKTQLCLCYRKPEFTRLNDTNLKDIEDKSMCGDCELKLGVDISEVSDEDGKPKVHFTDGSTKVYDRLIYAIGGTTPVDFLSKCGVNVDDKKIPCFDENKQTNAKYVYVAGDIATKNGACIVVALNDGVKISSSC